MNDIMRRMEHQTDSEEEERRKSPNRKKSNRFGPEPGKIKARKKSTSMKIDFVEGLKKNQAKRKEEQEKRDKKAAKNSSKKVGDRASDRMSSLPSSKKLKLGDGKRQLSSFKVDSSAARAGKRNMSQDKSEYRSRDVSREKSIKLRKREKTHDSN
mmetsp:Transcript_885/g.1342  ORF Transcript_885/g.1342 Transcript_885/m.1342 type:complete len:155 (-) Transcript_885:853-1317(-)